MRIDWDVPIPMEDGVILRCDIFRPEEDGEYPVIMSYGPYGKWLHFEDGYKSAWDRMTTKHPDVVAGSTNKYQSWEVVDPEKFVPHGYACVRVDSRGAGRSPGYMEVWSPREAQDYYNCIEWAAEQDWCDGKIGLNGISYYATNQWQVAAMNPPHLTAICIWEGFADFYRDCTHHGGILCTFVANWYDMQVKSVQYGLGENGYRSRLTGGWVSGPESLTSEERGSARFDFGQVARAHAMDDEYWKARTPDFSKITVPVLSSGNWGGQGLHPRGNFEGFSNVSSKDKWLEVHGIEHWTEFYTDYGIDLQLRFFNHFLKGEKNGWDQQPKVQLQVRHVDHFVERHEDAWPLPSTQWTKYHLGAKGHTLSQDETSQGSQVSFKALGDGVTFLTEPLEADTELTGPIAARLNISSSTEDADFFLVVRVLTPNLEEVVFQGALDPNTPVAQGWLRASHRKLDTQKSEPYRPYHTHDEKQPLTPGEVYELDIEIWPTCIVVPAGCRIALSVRGRDYVYPGPPDAGLSNMKNKFTGVGPFLHDDPVDRPIEIFGGTTTLHLGEGKENWVMLPVIPARK
ncbi:CocE/NonD family hydrolase [Aureimonas fodinaquatilis]|uniref:CocE/NonD family hydrolase n=2 Tax=Aureimonas fodinaquatilis TaxID=2565783 RepID=A0A5B0DXL1_9HYPH|nr:CocE/NonD family hydrolase [Aureimonas fodinaquatilis]